MSPLTQPDDLTADMLPRWWADAVAALSFPLGWKAGADPSTWRRNGREAVRALLLEDPAPAEAAPRVLAIERRSGYRVELVELSLGQFRRTRAFLAIPDGPGPFPALVALHDHGAFFDIGKEKMIRPLTGDPKTAVSLDWAARNYDGLFVGDEWARRGWVVFAADALGWGDRVCGGYETQQAVASNLFNLGSSWAGVIAAEDTAAAAFLAGHPQVDPRRVAALGHSMGGYRSYQLAALSDHVTAAVAACCFAPLRGVMVPGANRVRGQSAFSMTHPGLARRMDFPDLAALAAPKPLFFLHGTEDKLFPEAAVREACAQTSEVYQAWGRPEAFRAEFRPGGHSFGAADQALAFAWLEALPSEGPGVASAHGLA